MHTARGHAARNRRRPDTDGTQRAVGQVPPHKERALWNFLTWSFFLAQILAADQLLGGQAKAAGDLDLPASDVNAEAAASLSNGVMPAEGVGNAGPEEAGAVRSSSLADDGVAASMKSGQVDGPAITLEAIQGTQSQSSDQVEVISSGGVLAASEHGSVAIVMPSIANDIHGSPLDVVTDTVDPILDTVENIVDTLDDIVGDITDTLGNVIEGVTDPLLETVETVVSSLDDILNGVTDPLLNVLGDVVPDLVAGIGDGLGDIVDGTVDPLLNAAGTIVGSLDDILDAIADPLLDALGDAVPNLVADLGGNLGDVIDGTVDPLLDTAAADALDDLLASAGELIFPVLNIVGMDDLYSGGRYTDYNLALQAKLPPVPASSDTATSSSNPIADVLAALSGAGYDEPVDNADDSLHVPHIAIPGILDGIGLRGLGDGIV